VHNNQALCQQPHQQQKHQQLQQQVVEEKVCRLQA
jgi:hypothetical protein